MKSKTIHDVISEIRKNTFEFSFNDGDFLSGLPEPHMIETSVLPILLDTGSGLDLLGTSFCINSNGYLLTSKHVLEDITTKFESEVSENNWNIDFSELSLYVFYCTNVKVGKNKYFGGLMPINTIRYCNDSDIALLTIDMPLINGVRIPLFALTLSPGIPKPHQNTLAIGYSKKKNIPKQDLLGNKNFLNNNLNASKGVIAEIHEEKRDSVMLKFPCFRTTARYDHGMSGGPIIAENGRVVGIITSSITTENNLGPYTSYGALLPPLLALKIRYRKNEESNEIVEDYFYDMVRAGYFHVDDSINQIKVIKNKEMRITSILYSIPKSE